MAIHMIKEEVKRFKITAKIYFKKGLYSAEKGFSDKSRCGFLISFIIRIAVVMSEEKLFKYVFHANSIP